MLRSLEVFLAFLGLRFQKTKVTRAEDFEAKEHIFADPNHNWMRITRVLSSARILGLEEQSSEFFDFLKKYRDSGRSGITGETFRYWSEAATGRESK